MNKKSICCFLRPLREKVAEGRMRGFTLIELLVVVIIIAILAAIAVPQYKHAVLKSRFSTVMPMAKAIADAQEVYYQGRQLYALDVDELDVTPVNAENTSVALSQTDGYDYVMAQNSQVPGANYIIYQKYSENYPSEIHCEAEDDNADAQWLCGVLSNNNSIGKTITDGYTTYIINGTGAGVVPGTFEQAEEASNPMSCDKAIAMGFTCTSDETTGVKKICVNGVCRTKTYNEDGSYTRITCLANNEGVCTSKLRRVIFDENGNAISDWYCNSVAADGSCSVYGGGSDYTYDSNGNRISSHGCQTVAADGSCRTYYSFTTFYTYDEKGNTLTKRLCDNVAANGSCSAYSNSSAHDYIYDANGNQTALLICNNVAANGSCNNYANYRDEYTYDANGNRISSRRCSKVAENGSCNQYVGNNASFDYTYDSNGKITSMRTCGTLAADGSCSVYSRGTDYGYDDTGKQIYYRYCSGNNLNPQTGECIAYDGTGTDSSDY